MILCISIHIYICCWKVPSDLPDSRCTATARNLASRPLMGAAIFGAASGAAWQAGNGSYVWRSPKNVHGVSSLSTVQGLFFGDPCADMYSIAYFWTGTHIKYCYSAIGYMFHKSPLKPNFPLKTGHFRSIDRWPWRFSRPCVQRRLSLESPVFLVTEACSGSDSRPSDFTKILWNTEGWNSSLQHEAC